MIILSIIVSSFLVFASSQEILVNLPNGTLRGYQFTSGKGIPFYGFHKIPYAAPPLGNLRFEPPQPALSWTGIKDGTYFDIMCYQTERDDPQETEDCLYLNVFTTELPSTVTNETALKPVWINIHGGAFEAYNGWVDPRFLMDYDIVYVSLNYRLGPFGFLSTGDTVIPGNAALWDQHQAIRYVKENIRLFAGDPDKIVIGGQSAGASSVSFQLLNKANAGLFRGVIQESGSYLDPWSLQREAPSIARRTAAYINPAYSSITNTTELANILKNAAAKEIDVASYKLWIESGGSISEGFVYAPVIEVPHKGAFLTEKMYQLLRTGNFLNVRALIGFNSEEQIGNAADLNSLTNYAGNCDQYPTALIPLTLNLYSNNSTAITAAAQTIKSLYTNTTFVDKLGAFIRYQSDSFFIRSIIRQAQVQARFTPVYLYEFSYHGEIGNQPVYIEGADRVGHSEELRYLYPFDNNNNASLFTEPDRVAHYRFVELFTNFVKDLNPTSVQDEYVNITWTPVPSSGDEIYFLNINDTLQMQTSPKGDAYKGWVNLFDSFDIEEELDVY